MSFLHWFFWCLSPQNSLSYRLSFSGPDQADKYEAYLKRSDTKRDNIFSCLRGWSSAVTLLEGGKECQWSGGGYFLKWRRGGVVIDPGFDFLDNFHDAGYNGRDIDAVVVSHNHSDHNYDLRSVDDLRYELFRRWQTMPLPERSKVPRTLGKCIFLLDDDTKSAHEMTNDDCRQVISLDLKSSQRKRWKSRPGGIPLTIKHFAVDHNEELRNAVGMQIILHGEENQPDFILGYTGDTEYFEQLPTALKESDILLAHISMPDPEEYQNPDHYKKLHLGYNRLAQLILEVKPKLVLVGEFWAGKADLRIDLIQGLRRKTGSEAILPVGLGFHLSLPSLEVQCTCCSKGIPYLKIRVTPATTPFGPLGYLCEQCIA